jgi:hypothetical protein
MEEQILAVDLSTEQTLEVNLPEQDNVAQIDVYWQDEVVLDLDASLMYIVSGQQEIQDYVDNKSKPEIDEYIQDYAKPIVSEVVDQIATPVIDEYFENTVKPSITEFAEEEMAGYAATATAQAEIATEKANEASETAKIVDEKVQEFSQTTEASKNEFVNFAQEKTEEFEQTAITATEQAVGSAEHSRIWAEGEQAEVKPLGGELSSMGAADLAYAIANAPEDTPIDASGLFAMNVVKGEKGDKGDKGDDGKDGGGLEIGDVAFAVMGIDETKNLRRYLNGQVISQRQFVSFTNWVKERAKLYPNTVATEENWQAEVTNSKLGQCGKFVIDDTLGTIRLPKVVNINGLQDLSLLGSIKAESLPNISGYFYPRNNSYGAYWHGDSYENGALYKIPLSEATRQASSTSSNISDSNALGLDASRSSDAYQDNAPVQQESIQYPYFIQVATGVEETVDVTREIELNNPFSLLDYKWSEYELNNASWLLSNGAFHSGATYIAVYELLLKIHNGTETKEGVSVKLSTEAYTDTDFVINTADTTFRLPIKVKLASGNAVVGNGMTLGFTDGTTNYGLKVGVAATNQGLGIRTTEYGTAVGTGSSLGGNDIAKTVGITTDPTKSGIETSSDGLKLYFYVGETIQDANVINASGVLTRVAELSNEYIVGLGMPDYSAGVNITSLPYTAPTDGLISIIAKVSNTTLVLKLNDTPMLIADTSAAINAVRDIRVRKGDVLAKLSGSGTVPYNDSSRNEYSMFFPAKGAN